MFQPPPPSHSAPRPEVIFADAQQKWQGTRPGWRWVITILVIAVILALIIIMFFVIPE